MKSLQMALFVIGAAGFGRRIGWKEESILPAGHKLTFKVCELDFCSFFEVFTQRQDALATVSHTAVIKAVLPDWAMNLSEKTRDVKVAYDELEVRQSLVYNFGISACSNTPTDLHARNDCFSQNRGAQRSQR